MVESNRAFFCISHTSSTFSLSPSVSSTRTHPLPLVLGRYFCGIWVVFLVAIVNIEGVSDDRPKTSLLGFLYVLEDVADNVLALRRRDKDWDMFVLVTVFCGTVVGTKQVGYVTDSCDTDWGRRLRQALMICSRLHSNTICFHAWSLLITFGVSRPCVLVFHEVRRNLTTFGFNELPEAVGNGIILGIIGGGDDIFDGRWCGRRHMLGEGSGGAVFWNVKASYMHF